jgi:hypothetical protein
VELFDFYHNGIVVILGIETGVIGAGDYWATIPYGSDFDRQVFRSIKVWILGKIPFRNIRHYDVHGDEFYNFPHLYCAFDNDSMPYEDFAYAIVGNAEEYDWPLDPNRRLSEEDVKPQ